MVTYLRGRMYKTQNAVTLKILYKVTTGYMNEVYTKQIKFVFRLKSHHNAAYHIFANIPKLKNNLK